jgi:lipopolysaccharide heptosyltransferase II
MAYFTLQPLTFITMNKKKIHKVLIIRLSSIGDIILTSPLVRAVRKAFPDAQIDFLIKQEFADLMTHNPHVNRLIPFEKKGGFKGLQKLKRELAEQQYDWVIDLHKNLRSLYLRNGIADRFSTFSKEYFKRYVFINLKINLFKQITPVYIHYFDALCSEGIQYDGLGTEVFFTEKDAVFVADFLQQNQIEPSRSIVALCPGASYATKRWLPERFAQVADYIIEKYNYSLVLLGGKTDLALCEEIRTSMKNTALNCAGQFNLLQSAAMLRRSEWAITNDSGMLHLAQAQKRPVLAIFGCTVEELGYFPLPERSRAVQKNLPCRPCTHNGLHTCPKKHFDCMRGIETAQVIKELEILIRENNL